MEEQAQPRFERFEWSEEQALATFNDASEERRFLREQQWRITNYALLAFAALTAAPLAGR